jgi:hypothetical protein
MQGQQTDRGSPCLKDSDCGLLVESANIDRHSSQLQTLTRTIQSLEEDGLWTISPITQQTRGQTKRVMTLARTQRHVLRDGADVVEQDDHKVLLQETGASVSL